jgi:hypothetical protein
MKNILLLFAGALLFTACSAPKYAYHFDHYDYNSGKKQSVAKDVPATMAEEQKSPLILDQKTVEANAAPVSAPEKITVAAGEKAIAEKVASMTKTEQKELKKNLKTYLKTVKKSSDHDAGIKAAKAWDHDLKMAAIFGIIGAVLTSLYFINPVFWVLGVVALVVAVVFLIKWLSRQ